MAEQIGGGLVEIATLRQIHHRGGGVNSRNCSEAERQQCLAGLQPLCIEPHARARRVMRRQHARRQRLAAVALGIRGRLLQRAAQHALDLRARQAAGTQQHRFVEAADDGRFDADLDRAAIDDQVDPAREVALHMGRRGRRDMAREIGRRRHHRAAEHAQDVARHRVRRYPDRDRVEAGGGEVGHRAIRRLRQHQRQRARPECLGQRGRSGVKARDLPRGGEIADMGDQRIEGRPALGLVKAGDRGRIGGIGAEAIDGLGRERDQPAFGQDTRRRGHGGLAGGQNLGFQANIHWD